MDAGRAGASLTPRNSLTHRLSTGQKHRVAYRSSLSGENDELSCGADSATRSEPRRPALLRYRNALKLTAPTTCSTPHLSVRRLQSILFNGSFSSQSAISTPGLAMARRHRTKALLVGPAIDSEGARRGTAEVLESAAGTIEECCRGRRPRWCVSHPAKFSYPID